MKPVSAAGDVSTAQYSAKGFIFQLEYAEKAVAKSVNVIGLRCKDGVVLAVEKILLCPMYEENAAQRVYQIQENIALAFTGFWPDGNYLVELARQEAIKYRQQFERLIPLETLGQRIGDYMHGFTLNSAVRPFGVNILIASWDEHDGAGLYKIDNSGMVCGYFGCASGKGEKGAQLELEKLSLSRMQVKNLVQQAGRIIYQLHDNENEKPFHLELAVIGRKTDGLVSINTSQYHKMATRFGETSKRQSSRGEGGSRNAAAPALDAEDLLFDFDDYL